MLNKIIKGFVAVIGATSLILIFVYYTWEASAIPTWVNSGTIQSDIFIRPDSTIEFTSVDTNYFRNCIFS